MTATAKRPRYGVHPDTRDPRPASRAREVLSWVLLIAGCALAALALVAVWLDTLLIDADAYVDAVGPLAEETAVQQAVADVSTDGIMSALDLPAGEGQTRSVVRSAVEAYVGSGSFPPMWREANRLAHSQVVGLITGREGQFLRSHDGEVWLELGPIATAIGDRVGAFGVDASALGTIAGDLEYPILATAEIEPLQAAADRIERAAFWLPPAAVLLLMATVVVGQSRLRAAGRIGAGLTGSGALVVLAIVIGHRSYREDIPDAVPRIVADLLFDRLVDPLRAAALWLTIGSILLAVVSYGLDLATARVRHGSR